MAEVLEREVRMNQNQVVMVVLVVVVIAVVAIASLALRKRRSQKLREHFGPEYDRVVKREGNVRTAEGVLEFREKRREKLNIRLLSPGDRATYERRRSDDQAQVVDDPKGAVNTADILV